MGMAVSFSSCLAHIMGKDGYYDYDIGMYINGKEYHEYLSASVFYQPPDCGLRANTYDNMTSFYVEGGRSCDIVTRGGNTNYGLYLEMYIDSTKYDCSTRYFFSDTTFSDWELYNKFKNKEIVTEPILTGKLVLYDVKGSHIAYHIKEGWLLLGDNDCIYATSHYPIYNFYRYHCVKFEFIAESDFGDVLNVTDGFCKYKSQSD